jgi:Snare region anchored in the vesicle membrane C-terminus/Vesicle transport v-SNARE protein N-terminus
LNYHALNHLLFLLYLLPSKITMNDFDRYDDEFAELVQQIENSFLDGGGAGVGGPSSSSSSSYTQNLIQQADDLLKQMALEARSVPDASMKRELLGKVRQRKGDLANWQSKLEKSSLFGGGNGSRSGGRNDRERLLLQQTEDTLLGQNETLERARRTMEETEAVALEITEELGHNRETLMSTQGRIREVSGLTGRARRILTSMNQRAVQQKMIMYGVAVGLVLGFLLLLYTMW